MIKGYYCRFKITVLTRARTNVLLDNYILQRSVCRTQWYNIATGHQHILTWWRHQMETFSALLALCMGIHRWPVNSQHKGQWRGALMFSLICVWINGSVNNRETGDLRRYRAHYDVTAMDKKYTYITWNHKSLNALYTNFTTDLITFVLVELRSCNFNMDSLFQEYRPISRNRNIWCLGHSSKKKIHLRSYPRILNTSAFIWHNRSLPSPRFASESMATCQKFD